MESQRLQRLSEFVAFRRQVRALARTALEQGEPEYVQQFRATLEETKDFEKASAAARPLLGKGASQWSAQWPKLLTSTLDVDLTLDKTLRAVVLLGRGCPPLGEDWNDGAWTGYHYDHWVFLFHAWLERLDKLIKLSCRFLIKPRSHTWRQIEGELSGEVRKMKDLVEKIRHPLAHGGGGGVTGPEEERLWEPGLLIDNGNNVDEVYWCYQQQGQFRERWHKRLLEVSETATARSEAIFRKINGHISSR